MVPFSTSAKICCNMGMADRVTQVQEITGAVPESAALAPERVASAPERVASAPEGVALAPESATSANDNRAPLHESASPYKKLIDDSATLINGCPTSVPGSAARLKESQTSIQEKIVLVDFSSVQLDENPTPWHADQSLVEKSQILVRVDASLTECFTLVYGNVVPLSESTTHLRV